MYWPNEPAKLYPEFTQAGGRAAFEAMAQDGTIAALSIYSQRVERAKFPDIGSFEDAARAAITTFAPDILFVQHLFGTDVTEDFWKRLRAEMPQVTLVYHEGDVFDRHVKRLDRPTMSILPRAHLVFACGLGSIAEILSGYCTAPVEFLSHCFVKSRFAKLDPAAAKKTNAIVMIGNRGVRPKAKFLYVPGGRNRERFAKRLTGIFGTQFALYGQGWSHLASSRGSLPFFQQEEAIQSGRISANWDHFDTIDYYYSDRLPISLAAGVPHVTSYHSGYDHLFARTPGLYACKSIDEAVETCRWLLSRPDEELLEEGLAAKAWVFNHLEANVLFKRAMLRAIAVHVGRKGK
jgi:hypothetical protein